MNLQQRKTKNMVLTGVILLSVFLLALLFNSYTPMTVDDYYYSFNFATDEKLATLSDVAESMQRHYRVVNGRLIPHSIVQTVLLYFGKGAVANTLNSLMLLTLGYLIYKIANTDKTVSPIRLFLIYLLLFTFSPAIGQTMFWFDGAVNYLWGVTAILGVLYFYNDKFFHPQKYVSPWFLLAAVPLGFLAGGWSENGSSTLLMLEVLYMALYLWTYRKEQKFPLFYALSFVASFVSWLFMLTAPANAYRRTFFPQMGKREMLNHRLEDCFKMLRQYLYPILAMMVALLILGLFIQVFKNRFTNKISFLPEKNRLIVAFLFFLASMVANFVMVAAPYGNRSAFSPTIFLIVSLCTLASCFKMEKTSVLCCLLTAVLILCMGVYTVDGLKSTKDYCEKFKTAEAAVYQQKAEGEVHIKATMVVPSSPFVANHGLEFLSTNPKQDFNIYVAKYYEVESIATTDYVETQKSRVLKLKEKAFAWMFP